MCSGNHLLTLDSAASWLQIECWYIPMQKTCTSIHDEFVTCVMWPPGEGLQSWQLRGSHKISRFLVCQRFNVSKKCVSVVSGADSNTVHSFSCHQAHVSQKVCCEKCSREARVQRVHSKGQRNFRYPTYMYSFTLQRFGRSTTKFLSGYYICSFVCGACIQCALVLSFLVLQLILTVKISRHLLFLCWCSN